MVNANLKEISQLELAMLFNLCQYELSTEGWKSTRDIHFTFNKYQDKHFLSNELEEIPNILKFKSPKQAYTPTLKKLIKKKLVKSKTESYKDNRKRVLEREVYQLIQNKSILVQITNLLNAVNFNKEQEFYQSFEAYKFFLETEAFRNKITESKKQVITREEFLKNRKQTEKRYEILLDQILNVVSELDIIYNIKNDVIKDIKEMQKSESFSLNNMIFTKKKMESEGKNYHDVLAKVKKHYKDLRFEIDMYEMKKEAKKSSN